MKKIRIICLILGIVVSMCIPVSATTVPDSSESTILETEPTIPTDIPHEGNAAISNGCHTIEAMVPLLQTEGVSAESYLLYEVNSDTVLFSGNPDTPMSPASLVKIMTLLLAVEYDDLEAVVSVTESALSSVPRGALSAHLEIGEMLTMEQLLHCMMAGSANDAAAVVAEYISGSQGMFVAEMNQKAVELGCTNTNFTNVHGLHDSAQFTSARDLCRILTYAYKNETFRRFWGTAAYTVPQTNKSPERLLETTNYLLLPKNSFYVPQVTGGRTGVTEEDLRCLATTAEGDGMQYICVVLGGHPIFNETDGTVVRYGNYEDTIAMLQPAFSEVQITRVLSENQILQQYPVANGEHHVATGAQESVQVVMPKDVDISALQIQLLDTKALSAPIEKGQVLSTARIWYNHCCVAQVSIVARNPVPVASTKLVDTWTEVDTSPDLAMMAVVFILIAVVLILAAGTLYLVRSMRGFAQRIKSKRRRRDRRRSR